MNKLRAQDQADINHNTDEPDFSESCWDLIRAGAQDETAEIQSDQEKRSQLINNIDKIAEALKDAVTGDHQLSSGAEKFLKRFNALSSFPSKARLASALHGFGSEHHGISKSLKSGLLRRGKQIKSTSNCHREKEIWDKRQRPSSVHVVVNWLKLGNKQIVTHY